jgi:septum formation protein
VSESDYLLYPPFSAILNAIAKARSVAARNTRRFVLGADTMIEFEKSILGKPKDRDDAHRMLAAFSGQVHRVTTAVCIVHEERRIRTVFCDHADVRFKILDREAIRHYHSLVDPLDKAGAYGIQEFGDRIIESVEGEVENVMGLPRRKTMEALRACGAV